MRELAERGVLKRTAGCVCVDCRRHGGQCARDAAGYDRRPHRSPRPESETHVERRGGGRLAVGDSTWWTHWVSSRRSPTWWRPSSSTRSGSPANPSSSSAIRSSARWPTSLSSDRIGPNCIGDWRPRSKNADRQTRVPPWSPSTWRPRATFTTAYDWRMRAAAWSKRTRYPCGTDQLGTCTPGRRRDYPTAISAHGVVHCAGNGICATTWRVGGDVADNGFDELRKLCESVGDDLSLAIGMYGQMVGLTFQHRHREASLLASVQFALLQNSPDAADGGWIHPRRGFGEAAGRRV